MNWLMQLHNLNFYTPTEIKILKYMFILAPPWSWNIVKISFSIWESFLHLIKILNLTLQCVSWNLCILDIEQFCDQMHYDKNCSSVSTWRDGLMLSGKMKFIKDQCIWIVHQFVFTKSVKTITEFQPIPQTTRIYRTSNSRLTQNIDLGVTTKKSIARNL